MKRQHIEQPARGVLRSKINNDTDEISIEELEEGLPIDEHALDEALLRQPDFLYQVSKRLALQTSRRDSAKQLLTETEARVDAEIRNDAYKADEKITEKEVSSQKILNKEVQTAERQLLNLNLIVGQLNALKEAYQQRSYMLRELTSLYIANYYGDAPTKDAARQMRDADARNAKEGMNRMRRGE